MVPRVLLIAFVIILKRTLFNLNPYFCVFRSGAVSFNLLRNLSRPHSHNQCHSFIFICDSHPHHPTHPSLIIGRHFTTFLIFFSIENRRGRILSNSVFVPPFILENPLAFFRARAHSGFGILDDRFSCFLNPIGVAGPSSPA